jgi:tetratricopeptide (TPR) repeat protein
MDQEEVRLKYLVILVTAVVLMTATNFGWSKTIEEYVAEAEEYKNTGQFDKAISAMEQAVEEHPESSDAYAQLGIMLGEKAQRMRDYMALMEIAARIFSLWDKALELDSNNFMARFYRGAWAVNMPKSMGQLEKGIGDLEIIAQALEQSPDPSSKEQLVEAYQYLADGYQKNGEYGKAKITNEEIVALAPETQYAEQAQQKIDKIDEFEKWQEEYAKNMVSDTPEIVSLKEKVAEEPDNFDFLFALGKAYFDVENYGQAEKVLKRAVEIDQSNSEAYKLLAYTLGAINEVGYDPRIYMDTDFRTDLAFEAADALDKAVALAPEDIELRLTRGITAVNMPFFVNRIDQGIADLEIVIDSDIPDEMKAEATYWLGYAHQKKATTYWIRVVSKYSATDAAQDVFDRLRPPVTHIDLSKYIVPIVYVDFELSYRDELAPQTAVWVEKADEEFVKTLYVSGFSGYAKEQQVNLPVWAKSSEFADVDAVTGASIDLGHHVYIWDLSDYTGKKVDSGDYKILVEVSYWPSMQYQRVEAPIVIGNGASRRVVEEGNIIPYLEVRYLP